MIFGIASIALGRTTSNVATETLIEAACEMSFSNTDATNPPAPMVWALTWKTC